MASAVIAAIYIFLGAWLATGLVFALLFISAAPGKLATHEPPMTFGARLLVLPGAAVLWPFVLWRWLKARGKSV